MTATNSSIPAKDKPILDAIKPVVDGIVAFPGESCEVALHSFESLVSVVIH
jgi:predicted transcriptional regulator YheO